MMHVKFFALHHATPPQKVLSRLFQFNTIKYQGSSTSQTQTPNASSLRTRFRFEPKGLVKSSALKCTEHAEEDFPGVQCLHVP